MDGRTTELTTADRGEFTVTTASGSRHRIVLSDEGMWASRAAASESAALRRDEEMVELLDILRCEEGCRMGLVLTGVSDVPGTITHRDTTAVESIERSR